MSVLTSGHKNEDVKQCLYKALGRMMVWGGKLNIFLQLNNPLSTRAGTSPSLGLKFHCRDESSSKAWSKSCLLWSPGGLLAGSFCADRKSLPTQSHGWAVGNTHPPSSELESSQGVVVLHRDISVIGWVG